MLSRRARLTSWSWLAPVAAALLLALAALSVVLLGRLGYVVYAAALLAAVAAIVWNVERLLWALLLIDIPFGIDVNLLYREAEGRLGAVGGLNISLTTLYLLALYFLWLLQSLARSAPSPKMYLRQSWPLLLYLGFLGLSVPGALDKQLSIFELALLVQMLLLYIYFSNRVQSRADLIFVLSCLTLGLGLQSAIVLIVQLTGLDFSVASISTRVDAALNYGSRAVGTFGSPNGLAAYLMLVLGPSASLLFVPLKRRYKVIIGSCIATGILSLILTESRGGWLGFGLATLVIYLASWRRGYLPRRANIAILSITLVAALMLQPVIVARFSAEDTGVDNGRVPLNVLALELVRDNPVFGVGTNNYILAVQDYLTPAYANTWIYTVHNKFLQIWSEAGPLALLAYLSFLITLIGTALQLWRLNQPLSAIVALSIGATICGHILHMQLDIFTGRVYVQTLWLLAALLTALRYNLSVADSAALEKSAKTVLGGEQTEAQRV